MDTDNKYVRGYFWQTRIRKIAIWIIQIAAMTVLGFVCAYMFGQRVMMTESSMEPTVLAGDKMFINVAAYKLSSPKRGDIIAFKNGADDEGIHIKRVIGLPDETVQIRDGHIIIDGKTYIEDKEFSEITNPGIAEEPVSVGSNEYFVLGDNRNNSEDSRHLDVGLIKEENIIGKLWIRFSPMDRFGLVE